MKRNDMDRIHGMVYLVGAGPGDDSLITRRALDCLFACDTVVYDSLSSDLLLREVRPECERIYVGKRAGLHSMKQEDINKILIEKALEGNCVVRLKGGDPMVFGRGGEEVLALSKAGIAYQVVPGVTSAVAALTSAGIPVTHRGVSRSFHVMTGHIMGVDGSLPKDFEHFAKLEGTLIFLMGLNNLEQITEGLMRCGKPGNTPAAIIENGTLPQQRVVRAKLQELVDETRKQQIHSPAIIVVGEVAAFHMEPTLSRPLYGVSVGLAGTEVFVKKLSDGLEKLGARTEWLVPMKLTYPEECEKAFHKLNQYTWLVLTSANGVRVFFEKLLESGQDYRAIGHMKLAVIGQGTADELLRYGFKADYVPQAYCSRGLGQGLAKILSPKDRVWIGRAAKGSRELTDILSEQGVSYDDVILYDIQKQAEQQLDAEVLDGCQYLALGSGSGVEALVDVLGIEGLKAASPKLVCIGDITAGKLEACGRVPDITADRFCVDGLIEAILNDVSGK